MCGILGLLSTKNVSFDLYHGLLEIQHRGQDSAGFVTYDTSSRDISIIKGVGLITEVVSKKHLEETLVGNWGIAQVRYPTVGINNDTERRRDAQPTYTSTPGFAMAHNGNISNVEELKKYLASHRRYLKSNCDVELINLLLAEKVSSNTNSGDITSKVLFKSVKQTMEDLKGSYSVIAIIQDVGFLAFRDPYAIRPMVIGVRESDNSIGFSSESVALNKIGYKLLRDVQGGEAIFFPIDGNSLDSLETKLLFENHPKKHCMFERVYFARPASVVDGDGIYLARLNLGKELANEMLASHRETVESIEVIAPTPDSPRPVALNLARKLEKRHVEIFDKNRYMGRSFINPEQEKRIETIKSKLSPIIEEIAGKEIGVVDDSIVRGNTSKIVVDILRNAGAKKVHYIVGCPPLTHPCQLGIDMPTKEELIASGKQTEEIRKTIGADSVIYLSVEGLQKALGALSQDPDRHNNYCYGCLTGEYPVSCIEEFSKNRKKDRHE